MPKPPTPLDPSMLMRQDEVPTHAQPPSLQPPAPPPPPRVYMSYRPTQKTHDRLKLIAVIERTNMQKLVDRVIEEWLEANHPTHPYS